MTNKQNRTCFAAMALAAASVTLLGGCTHDTSKSLEMFLTDLLRSAMAAFLL
ncbi:MAG: hypothetical protein DHS20C16_11160 [Phycisphaerae bacterium]|nr:MAG: hypothetical protein DHS20C16_11160 [Phycisphaerae bacterium]